MRTRIEHLSVVLALVVAATFVDVAMQAARPVADRVVIRRDTYGVPHVRAEDVEAAGFGFAYAQAEDHAEEMGRRYLVGRGEAARHFGPALLASDLALARLRNLEEARRAVRTLGRSYRKWLRGFVAGFNQYVASHRAELPPWMPTIDEADVLAHGRAGSVTSALQPPRELLEKYPAAAVQTPAAAGPSRRDDDRFALDGSNAFAIAGSKTTSGRPILLGNPHLAWASRYWEAHVTIGDTLDFYGSTLVGLPVLRAGFNERLGYVQTNNDPDLEDIYALPLDPARPDHYVADGRSRALARDVVAVDLRREDGSMGRETREFWSSPLGPIVHRTPTHAFAVRSAALESWRSHEGFYELWSSRSLREFRRRLGKNLHYFSNFTYADADGNILYQWNARLPRRRDASVDYSLDVPAEPRLFWKKLHDLDDLPRLLNPPGGYVQNANNAPWWTSLRDRLDPASYPSYIERDPLALRPQVVLEELERRDRLSPDDVRAVKFTTRMLLAERVVPDLLGAVNRQPDASADARAGADVLRGWDRRVGGASRGAVLFQRFWDLYRDGRRQPFAEPFDPARPLATPRGLADPASAVTALARATVEVREAHGTPDIAWGDVNRFRFNDIDLPADGAPGAFGTYRVMNFEPQPDGRRIAGRASDAQPLVGNGDAWVLMVHFTRPLEAWSVLAYGQTTRAGSPHVSDQIRLFAEHRLRRVFFTEADIAAHTEREYRPR